MGSKLDRKTLTINKSDEGQNLLQIGGAIDQPLAQIIMVDGEHGDCNVIDLCNAPIDKDGYYSIFVSPTYSRFIMDTGPHKYTRDRLLNVLTSFGQPKFKRADSRLSTPSGWQDAVVKLLQLSHIDNDHCGNGGQLIELVKDSRDKKSPSNLSRSFSETVVMYHELQPLQIKFKMGLAHTEGSPEAWPSKVYSYPEPLAWLDRIGSDFRILHNYSYQFVQSRSTLPKAWKPILESIKDNPNSTVSMKITLNDWKKARSPDLIAVRGTFRLQVWDRVTKANNWIDVGCEEKKSPTAVQWETEKFFRVKESLLGILLRADVGGMQTESPGQESVSDFEKIQQALEKITKESQNYDWKPAPFAQTVCRAPMKGKQLELGGHHWKVEIVGPTEELYWKLMKEVTLARFELATPDPNSTHGKYGPHSPGKVEVRSEDIKNRASIITLFSGTIQAESRDPAPIEPFRMLFTGDAYDRNCDIQDSLDGILEERDPDILDVLKVPHHCSEVTSNANFYRLIRARVYLICAQQKKHGNPSLTTLQAIAAGFAQSQDEYENTQAPPWLLFFSDPHSLTKVNDIDSNVWQLLNKVEQQPWVPPNNNKDRSRTVYNYRCFRLQEGEASGRIVFGRTQSGQLAVQFSVVDSKKSALNDWIEMRPTQDWRAKPIS